MVITVILTHSLIINSPYLETVLKLFLLKQIIFYQLSFPQEFIMPEDYKILLITEVVTVLPQLRVLTFHSTPI